MAAVFYAHRSGSAEDSGSSRQDGAFMIASIALSGPAELAVDPQTGTVYATQVGGKTVWAIDKVTRKPHTIDIKLDDKPDGIAVDPATHSLYVTTTSYGQGGNGSPEGVLLMIDPAAHAITATVKLGGKYAGALAVDAAGQFAYVGTSNGLAVVDLHAHRVATLITSSDVRTGVAIDPGTDTVYCADYTAGAVLVVDSRTRNVSARISVEQKVAGLALDSSTHTIYTTDDQGNTLAAVAGSRHDKILVGSGPGGVAVDPSTHSVFVANFKDGTVSVVDGATRAATSTIAVGKGPYRVAVDTTARTVYVSTTAGIKAITPA
ncbi:YncE family protein [Nocardia sp. R7R-8]|uniref:YncE family protein n=1 Tax=Nocardia sp. R7R-8 TaxID=3459304 RepID=UPI00403D8443